MIFLGNKGGSKSKKGFTLIELMVVISIISLLASIVLASLQNVRERATIAKLLSFATSVKHLNWDAVLGEWKFNDSTNLGKDTSGNGMTLSNFGGIFSNQPVINGTLSLDNTNTKDMEITDTVPSKLGDGATVLTIEAMIKPSLNNDYFGIIGKYSYGINYRPSTNFTGAGAGFGGTSMVAGSLCTQCLVFQFWNKNDIAGTYAHSVNMTPNTWHQITVAYNVSNGNSINTVRMYFDGVLLKTPSYYVLPTTPLGLSTDGDALEIGAELFNSGYTFPGLIDEVRIYTSDTGL